MAFDPDTDSVNVFIPVSQLNKLGLQKLSVLLKVTWWVLGRSFDASFTSFVTRIPASDPDVLRRRSWDQNRHSSWEIRG